MDSTTAVLDRLDRATAELHAATKAALELAKATVKATEARIADDDDWTRMPPRGERCREGWSLRSLQREIEKKNVRKKRIGGFAYYSAADVRRLIAA
jgi:hypothetical protein